MDDSKRTAQIRARLAAPASSDDDTNHISDLLHLLCELDAERAHRRAAEEMQKDGEQLERDLTVARSRIAEIAAEQAGAEQVHHRLYAGLVFTRHLLHQAADAGRDTVPVDLVGRALDGDIEALREHEDREPRQRPCQDHQAVDGPSDREPCDELRAAANVFRKPGVSPWLLRVADLLDHMADDMQDEDACSFVAGNGRVYVRPKDGHPDTSTRNDWSAALWAARAINQATP